jgi:hypothetical protein
MQFLAFFERIFSTIYGHENLSAPKVHTVLVPARTSLSGTVPALEAIPVLHLLDW